MTFANHDQAVQQAYDELDRVRQQGNALVTQHINVLPHLVSSEIGRLVQQAIAEKPTVVQGLTKAQRATMKQRVQDIRASIPTLAQTSLSRNELWPHRLTIPTTPDAYNPSNSYWFDQQRSYRTQLNVALRDLVGEVGALLIEYGFATTGSDGAWEARGAGQPPRYRYAVGSAGDPRATDLENLNKSYYGLLQEYQEAARRVVEAERAKASAEAKQLWDVAHLP